MKVLTSTIKNFINVLVIVSFTSVAIAQTAKTVAPSNTECISCHKDNISTHAYNSSVHQTLKCTACHVKADAAHQMPKAKSGKKACVVSYKPMNCSSCHANIAKEHQSSIHNSTRLKVGCAKCHDDIHTIKSIKNDKIAAAKLCNQCHEKENDYFSSTHFKALKRGSKDAATCTDCHGLHAIKKIDNVAQGRTFHTQACLKCHGDAKIMSKSHVTSIAPETYFQSYHGKNIRLGYPERVAGCADCHGSHKILPEKDKNSMVNHANLTQTCKACHTNASAGFAKFIPHAEPTNKEKYPSLFWVTLFMNGLMGVTFIFFWVHSLLWAFRGYVEKKQNQNEEFFAPAKAKGEKKEKIKNKVYRRFRPVHIILHLFVISSFLGLAITGLPLKFNDTSWGKTFMDLIGGVVTAGIIHRVSAIITFGYFVVTLAMSIRFLFSKDHPEETIWQRLFGPDSLFPNMKDARDMKAMFKWFFFRGPKPTFDRWTYWEKFDFLAVFWGVAVIGSSGLILWFPEFFGTFMPGWMFNIATIIHSDEALLAIGFIFTIHFFNTHLRVEKFPMDFVIFNGQITEEEMVHERKEQWERYKKQGVTKEYEVNKPVSLWVEIALRLFGLVAVVTGTILAMLIIYTFFQGGGH
ncbi:MAG: cytochrome C [Cytophagaceae bacterium]|nr:cytochrome C [Cytophagaceae bacterium]MBL0327182.1 cytochrome C [Cytophagaceae bacterium]